MEACYRTLQEIARDPSVIDDHDGLKTIIAKIHREGKRGQNQRRREERVQADRDLRAQTVIVREQSPANSAPMLAEHAGDSFVETVGAASRPIRCYVCKELYTELHFHYHLLCPECAGVHYAKRGQRADLAGRTALITGGRIKIGYEMALRLLRDGARVIVTTRFPIDAAERFAAEPDSAAWLDRLLISRIDLRDIRAVEELAAHLLQTEAALDIVIHNAAQTVKRTADFYQELLAKENFAALGEPVRRLLTADDAPYERSDTEANSLLPGRYDHYGQPIDRRASNSWSLRLDEVETVEMLEVQLVNVTAPFVLNSRLKPLLLRSPHARRFIVNVSAMEGQFDRPSKTIFHPHTNMAKAALNMMTRTSAADYARDGVYMNSVDTGWITDENPYPKHLQMRAVQDFYTPLDLIDGMARIYDPIAQGLLSDSEPLHGHFLKDYKPYPW
ncbi:oxidoreductase [Capsulimonas corticalis]|uniref:Oxidoreductase n=1 Tax=Capsulimonas corticalis TaxID=2219043 RepID=A0A402CWV0_9BACT|nr:oxidoreductase [Capsulimonas corticalis]